MLKVRVIPCLDVKDGRVVKGVNFVNLRDAGDPVEAAIAYDDAGADELCFLKGMWTEQFNHAPAELLLYTGSPRQGRPSFGSWVTYGIGSESRNLPGFIVLVSGGVLPSAGKSAFVVKGGEVKEFGPHESTVAALDFSKDGSRIGCAHYGGVTVWSIGPTAQPVTLPPRKFAWRGSHVALKWSTDGKFIATGTQENDIHVWRMAQATDMRMQGYPAKVKSLSWTADARFLYTSAQPVFTAWPFAGKGPEGKPPLQFGEEGAGLISVVAAHPAAEFVAGGYDSGELQLGDIKTRRSVVLKMADGSAITCLAWSPDGYKLAVGNDAGTLLVLDLRR